MKIVISCCKSKNGEVFQHDGQNIHFVASLDIAPHNGDKYVHPDDIIPNEAISWRELVDLQQDRPDLIAAYKLYKPHIYSELYNRFNEDLYICSAGWGIVNAGYKLPNYDITFSRLQNIPLYARRNNFEISTDFNHLANIDGNELILLIASKDYVLPFCKMVANLPNSKIIIYKDRSILNNNQFIDNNGFEFRHYITRRRTNWHYEYAEKLINEEIEI